MADRSRRRIRVNRDRSRGSVLALGLAVALLYGGVNWIGGVEVATLRARLGPQPYEASVFVVDDPPNVWIRAERSDRRWLRAVREHSQVRLVRGDREIAYDAIVSNGRGGNEHIDALFRRKYGVLDVLAGWTWRKDPVPVRLEPSF